MNQQSALLTKTTPIVTEAKSTSQMFMNGHILSYRYTTPDKPDLYKTFHTKVLTRDQITESILSFETRTLDQDGKVHFVKVFSSNTPYMDLIWDELLSNRTLHWKDKHSSLRKDCPDLRSRVLFETPEHSEYRKMRAEKWARENADSSLLASINL